MLVGFFVPSYEFPGIQASVAKSGEVTAEIEPSEVSVAEHLPPSPQLVRGRMRSYAILRRSWGARAEARDEGTAEARLDRHARVPQIAAEKNSRA